MKKLLVCLCAVYSLFGEEDLILQTKIFSPTVSGSVKYENNIQMVQGFYSAIEKADLAHLSSILSDEYNLSNVGDIQGSSYSKFTEMSKNLKIRVTALHKSFPDLNIKIDELVTEGNKVVAKGTISGIQKGVFLGIAPTNKPIHIKFFDLFTIKEGKIVHISEMWNELSVMKQLGYFIL